MTDEPQPPSQASDETLIRVLRQPNGMEAQLYTLVLGEVAARLLERTRTEPRMGPPPIPETDPFPLTNRREEP